MCWKIGLPETDRELETRLEVNVVENLRNAAGRRVWRAGFNDSGVSNHNRVVERHESRYGAYWKSYDFAGSVGTQHIFTHPLSFTHDGGEIIFNLPNGFQAYYLADAGGNRLNEAPISIVRNPAASDPTVRNGLSCIGCHTEGMKTFEDEVRGVVEQNANPPFNKDRALRLYVEKAEMDAFVAEDTERYRRALEETGGVFGGIEPIQRFHEAFQRPLEAAHAAAAVGLETEAFLQKIQQNVSLQNLGLLVLENRTMKRDTWTEQFSEVVFALDFPSRKTRTVDPQVEIIPGESVYIPDPNLRAAIAESLDKKAGAQITAEEMATLRDFVAESSGIRDLTGLEFATNLHSLNIANNLISDLSPLSGLTHLASLFLYENKVFDLSPLTELHNLASLDFAHNRASDLSPLVGLKNLSGIHATGNNISDLSPLSGVPNLKSFGSWDNPLSDLSPLIELESIDICGGTPDISTLIGAKNLKELYFRSCNISDISLLAEFTGLERLSLEDNKVLDISPLTALTKLKWLNLEKNNISDVSALGGLANLEWLNLEENAISDFLPLEGLQQNTAIRLLHNPGSPKHGPKIVGTWLWMITPIGDKSAKDAAASGVDFLAEISEGDVTELKVATNGAVEGNPVGDSVWVSHKISASGIDNINDMVNVAGLGIGDINRHVAYGVVHLFSPKKQNINMFVGSSDAVKVWLNGKLVHNNPVHRGSEDYQDMFPVILEIGINVLLVAVYEDFWEWGGFFGFEQGAAYTVTASNSGIGYNFSETAIHVGDTFTLDLRARNIIDLAGWQFDIAFDPTVLEAIEVNEGDFLKTEGESTFFQKGTIDNRSGKITGLSSALLSGGGVTGTGTLLSVNFSAKAGGETQLKLQNVQFGTSTGDLISAGPHEVTLVVEGQLATGDVNRDGQVSILDMILIAQQLGKTVPPHSAVDVNGDGTISILDMILVAQHLGESIAAAAPSILTMDDIHRLDPAMVQTWIAQAQIENDGSAAFREGIAYLQSLLALLIPEETRLLPNYPNPFNPETWIPYQLSEPAGVTVRIYSVNGVLVRTLVLGHIPAGIYQSRNRAAYWNGRNEIGEPVASGLYFYTLTAGDFTATRKMLIRK
ncbi:MAG: leucine-rich repeat domain-containing protein [Candidatus Poribacteria bacterium]|nr:leucine-rich repeat domain-containing protein [Candidatus Poribacteria bacterium]